MIIKKHDISYNIYLSLIKILIFDFGENYKLRELIKNHKNDI